MSPPEPSARRRVDFLDVPIDALSLDDTVEVARSMIAGKGAYRHVSMNASLMVDTLRDPDLLQVVRDADLISADGMSVVWACRVLGKRLPERVAGIDLFLRLVEIANEDGRAVYFLGASRDVVQRVVEVFTERHPGLRVAGYRDGYWHDDAEVIRDVRDAAPDILFLAIPSPRKEFWISQHLHEVGEVFAMGVGGSFDLVAGKVSRAPRWLQRAGLEWAWRLGQEPRRMWRRYLFSNAAFLRLLVIERWRTRRTAGSPPATRDDAATG